jgi:capsular polysaccharide biosynthesis protein
VSGQKLDLVSSWRIIRQHKRFAGAVVALGLAGSIAYTMTRPPVFTSDTLVVLEPSVNVSTQTVVVASAPVLTDAIQRADLGVSFQALQREVQATRAAAQMISISAQSDSAARAERIANAVTQAYISYMTSMRNPLGTQPAELLQSATPAIVKPFTTRVFEAGGLGGLLGLVVALIATLAIWRNDKRLRDRDAIADSIGVSVLASIPAKSPTDGMGWARLLESYEPDAADRWLLRQVLAGVSGGSVAILSVSADRDGLALGPQLAVFAASTGLQVTLAVGPQQHPTSVATLALAASGELANPRLVVTGDADAGEFSPGRLTVVVSVVDGDTPRVAETMRADLTLLAVTAGVVTAQRLARVAASAAGDGRPIAGILVANPDRGDQTTGRVPQLARPEQPRMPTRLVGLATEIRL